MPRELVHSRSDLTVCLVVYGFGDESISSTEFSRLALAETFAYIRFATLPLPGARSPTTKKSLPVLSSSRRGGASTDACSTGSMEWLIQPLLLLLLDEYFQKVLFWCSVDTALRRTCRVYPSMAQSATLVRPLGDGNCTAATGMAPY
jgi:hypothetical protein